MQILITGATGFVGSHIASTAIEAGHDVRLLVRNPARLAELDPMIRPVGADVIVGDATDKGAVGKALDGVDAVVHTAAMVSMERKDATAMYEANTAMAEHVLGAAVHLGIDRIVSMSSVSVFAMGAKRTTLDTPLRMARDGYSRSKVAAERYTRGLQDAGAPITTLYPSGILGPYTIDLTAMHNAAVTWIQQMPVMPTGINIVDVRDVAGATLAALDSDSHAGRYLLGGHFLTWRELADTIEELTGTDLRRLAIPGPVMRGLGRFADSTRIKLPTDFPLTTEAMKEATKAVPVDSKASRSALGFSFRDRWTTLRDTYRWLIDEGYVPHEFGGALAGS